MDSSAQLFETHELAPPSPPMPAPPPTSLLPPPLPAFPAPSRPSPELQLRVSIAMLTTSDHGVMTRKTRMHLMVPAKRLPERPGPRARYRTDATAAGSRIHVELLH